MDKNVLLLLGGQHHDFDGFARAFGPVLHGAGYRVDATYDLTALADLSQNAVDVVLLYTCFGSAGDDEASGFTPAQSMALADWLQQGGGLLAVHAATVSAKADATLRQLMGGAFINHPPQFAFTVTPLAREHPVTAGIEAFTVHDEFYIQSYDAALDVHMVAFDRGVCYPMVWSKRYGRGKTVHVAPGHGQPTWGHPAYQQLMVQALGWLCS